MEGEPPYIILLIGHFPSQFVLLICSFVCNYNNACTCDLDLKERINETGGKQTFWVQTHAYISYSISLVFFLFVIYSFKSLLLYVVTRTWMKLQIYSAETNIKCFHLVFWSLSVTFVMFFHLVLFSRFFVCLFASYFYDSLLSTVITELTLGSWKPEKIKCSITWFGVMLFIFWTSILKKIFQNLSNCWQSWPDKCTDAMPLSADWKHLGSCSMRNNSCVNVL